MGGRKSKNKEPKEKKPLAKWKKVILIVLIVILMIFAILAGIATYFIADKLGKIQIEDIDETAIGITDEANKALAGYRNIALLGIDSRQDDYGIRK